MKYTVNAKGYYGQFGGAFIPEMLYPNVEELRTRYLQIITDPDINAISISCSKIMSEGQPPCIWQSDCLKFIMQRST